MRGPRGPPSESWSSSVRPYYKGYSEVPQGYIAERREHVPGYGGFYPREDVMTNDPRGRIKDSRGDFTNEGKVPGYGGYLPGKLFKVSGEDRPRHSRLARSGQQRPKSAPNVRGSQGMAAICP